MICIVLIFYTHKNIYSIYNICICSEVAFSHIESESADVALVLEGPGLQAPLLAELLLLAGERQQLLRGLGEREKERGEVMWQKY